MKSPVFGDLEYGFMWRGTYDYPLFGQVFRIVLAVPCDEGRDIEPAQTDAFLRFDAIKARTSGLLTRAVFDHYQGIVEERREMAGAAADEIAPRVQTPDQMASLITPTELVVQGAYGRGERVVGLLFDCRWDPSLGLAAKFVNEALEEIGPQDIVL